jgi:hypothetical protein
VVSRVVIAARIIPISGQLARGLCGQIEKCGQVPASTGASGNLPFVGQSGVSQLATRD